MIYVKLGSNEPYAEICIDLQCIICARQETMSSHEDLHKRDLKDKTENQPLQNRDPTASNPRTINLRTTTPPQRNQLLNKDTVRRTPHIKPHLRHICHCNSDRVMRTIVPVTSSRPMTRRPAHTRPLPKQRRIPLVAVDRLARHGK